MTVSPVVRYAKWVTQHPWRVMVIALALLLTAASGARFLQFTTDYRVFFSKDNPQLQAFENLENSYTKEDNVLIVVAPKSGQVFTLETLEAIRGITRNAWQIPYSIRVDSVTNFQHTFARGDDLVVQDLARDVSALTDADLKRIKAIALQEPALAHRLISTKAHVTGINATIQLPGKNPIAEVPEVVNHVREMVQMLEAKYPELDFYTTGMVMLNNAFSEASQNDMQTLVPITFIVILASIGLLLRGWTGTLATFWVIIFSIAGGLGMAGWLGMQLTPPSASAPTIILTLAVANAVHVLVSFFHALHIGETRQEAMTESLRINMQPVFLTSLTTAVGFISMNFSDSPPFRDLGNIVAMGVIVSFFLAMTLLPAIMMLLPDKTKKQATDETTTMEHLADFIIRHQNRLLVGMAVLIIALVSFVPSNKLNDEWLEYFDTSIKFRTDTDFVTDNLTGFYRIDYSLDSGEPGGVSNPEFLKQVDQFADWYRQQPEAIHINSFTDTMKRLNKNMHGDKQSWYRLPDERNLAAQYLLLYEMSLPYGLDLNNQINVDKSATRFSVTIEELSVNQTLDLENRAQGWLKANTPAIQSDGAGSTVMFAHIGQRNIKSMLTGTTLALVLISLILVIALRSIKIGLISLIPNLVPAAMGFGIWGAVVGEVGMGLAVVAGMTLGIVVDDTVHFLSKYLRARREKHLDAPAAVRYAFATVGTALWFTSAALIAGFLVLTLSSFRMNSDMGTLTAITIALALAADFLFLPPLLMKLDRRNVTPVVPQAKAADSAPA
ncbi:MAG: MMPL family transporter [Gammaproteobacteria bacterium]|nr:MMPL family transporter [Gammaproteobacteria bacterium]